MVNGVCRLGNGHLGIDLFQKKIPPLTSPISHNASFCNSNVQTCAHFCHKMVHCGIFVSCIVGFVRQIDWTGFGVRSHGWPWQPQNMHSGMSKHGSLWHTVVNRACHLTAIAGTTLLVPSHVVRYPLQLIWRWGTHRFHLGVPCLQMRCRDSITWQGTRIIVPAMAARVTCPFLLSYRTSPQENSP